MLPLPLHPRWCPMSSDREENRSKPNSNSASASRPRSSECRGCSIARRRWKEAVNSRREGSGEAHPSSWKIRSAREPLQVRMELFDAAGCCYVSLMTVHCHLMRRLICHAYSWFQPGARRSALYRPMNTRRFTNRYSLVPTLYQEDHYTIKTTAAVLRLYWKLLNHIASHSS